jgi:glutaminyl-peptide cyclotransferase
VALTLALAIAACAATPAPTATLPPTATASPTATVAPTLTPTPTPAAHAFDGEAAYLHVLEQDEPRPTGSEAIRGLGDYIGQQLQASGWQVETQDFTYMDVGARNVIGRAGSGPVVIIGAHYDTRRVADQDPDPAKRTTPVPGANDGASGVAVLLELASALDKSRLANEVWLTFFDAEDNGDLDGWDWSAGSTYMADNLQVTPAYVVVLDMIGDADQQIYKERNSDPVVQDQIWAVAAGLGYQSYFIPQYKWAMTDDHTPFLRRGIAAVDVIDFDYPYWHTTEDTADKVSPEALERVGRVMQALLETK